MIVRKTPFRMSFVGNGSDMPADPEETGAGVSTLIDKYLYIAVNRKFDERLRIGYSRTEEAGTPQRVAHPFVRYAFYVAGTDDGIDIPSMADIPSRGTWRLKHQMACPVSDSSIDDWCAPGVANGARGGKLLGAGRGVFSCSSRRPNSTCASAERCPNARR